MRKTSAAMVAIVLALIAIGIVMLASTSTVKGVVSFGDPHYFIKRQLVWLAAALAAGMAFARFDYHWWQKLSWILYGVSLLLLVLVFVPGIGLKVGGSHRWLHLGPMSFQSSELAKFSVVVFLSSRLCDVGRRLQDFKKGLLYPSAEVALILGLILLEPDFGTTILTGAVVFLLLMVAGAQMRHLVRMGFYGGCVVIAAIVMDPIRLGRVLAYIWPDQFAKGSYHVAQSKIAFTLGGWWGKGLGESLQKHLYLPEAHTDFILAIIGEERGLVLTLTVVLLFMGLLFCGMLISLRAPDPFGRLLGFGITMMIVLQAAINVGVVTDWLPTKGLPLPFISYGGSSLMMAVAQVGVLINIAIHAVREQDDEHTRVIRDREHVF